MKRVTLLAFAFAGLAACDVPTSPPPGTLSRVAVASQNAKSTTTQYMFDIAGTTLNPCNGEPVAFTGKAHEVVSEQTDASGATSVRVHINVADVSGVGLVTGDKYQLHENAKDDFTFSSTTFEEFFTIRDLFVSQGPTDNFWAIFTYRIRNGSFEIIRDETECRG